MRLLICVLIFLASCTEIDGAPERESPIEVVGRLDYKSLNEASGLARSGRDDSLLWTMNDDGPSEIFAMGIDGSKRGKVELRKAANRDWEDLAAFELDGQPYLLVADIGDNSGRRKDVRIYVIEEPDPDDNKVSVAWEFDFTYPEGPRDAESIAVDIDRERILVLTKRDIPARLYSLPLRPESDAKRIIADYLGPVDSLPQPQRSDVTTARVTNDWYWQPTSMTISADNRSAMILTYGAMYYFRRSENEAWEYAFRRPPQGLSLGRLPGAESITLGPAGDFAYITSEGRRAPILRIDLRGINNDDQT